ncbi:MAG: class II aldolase/adducin family protein [Desulfobacteraceae bacterium]|jgi:ribulose-5-phosphate 4-epimerase/fuculose-1-phosphate aldolase
MPDQRESVVIGIAMDRLVKKYAAKLIAAGLAGGEDDDLPLLAGLDDALVWNRKGPESEVLNGIFDGLNINSLVYLKPIEPYRTIIAYLARHTDGVIEPKDCETRTFLHDLPVTSDFTTAALTTILKKKKSVIIAPSGQPIAIAAHGTVSPEQGFVVVSSVCFACFVKFFVDYLDALRRGDATAADHDVYDRVVPHLSSLPAAMPELLSAPFTDEKMVFRAIVQAGRRTVAHHLVDSYFGNISYCWNDVLYISQTGSSLDELEGCVDPVPLDGTTSAGLTASSELSAHLSVIERSGKRAILHGHPKFTVIASMDCPPEDKVQCEHRDQCHILCPKARFVEDVPIVPGEVGTGPTGLCHTLPPALESRNAAIVYGHGLFTTGRDDFNEAFRSMVDVESACRRNYFEKVAELRKF